MEGLNPQRSCARLIDQPKIAKNAVPEKSLIREVRGEIPSKLAIETPKKERPKRSPNLKDSKGVALIVLKGKESMQ